MSTLVEAATLKQTATVLFINEMEGSLAYYRDALGFSVDHQSGMPTFYACLYRDGVSLHLIAARQTRLLPGQGTVCIFVNDVDAVHAQALAHGARIVRPPADRSYGMRDFDVLDLDGNQLTFGTPRENVISEHVA